MVSHRQSLSLELRTIFIEFDCWAPAQWARRIETGGSAVCTSAYLVSGNAGSLRWNLHLGPVTEPPKCRFARPAGIDRWPNIQKRFICRLPDTGQLVEERFPVGWHPSCGPRYRLTCGMRVRRKQFHTLDHPPSLVIVEPVLSWFEAGNHRMPSRRRVPGCMLTRRTVTASDVPTFRTPAEMQPPTFRRRQAFHTPVATWFRSGIKSTAISLHFVFPFRRCMFSNELKPPARSSRYHPFLLLPEPWPPH